VATVKPKPQGRNGDDILFEHFLKIVQGATRELGPEAARDLRRILARARATGNAATFTGYVMRLMMADASSNGWL